MEPLTILTLVAGAAGSFITIVSFLTLVCKPLREKFIRWIRKVINREEIDKEIANVNIKIDNLTQLVEKTVEQNNHLQVELDKQSEALKASLRNSILKIYYCCQKKGSITTYQLQNVTELYNNYKALGGNSFVRHLVEDVLSDSTQMPIRDNEIEGGV